MRHHSDRMTQKFPVIVFVKDVAEDFFLALVSIFFYVFLN